MTETTTPETPAEQPTTSRGMSIEHDGQTYIGQAVRIETTQITGAGVAIVISWRGNRIGVPIPATTIGELARVAEVAGVQTWEQLTGATVVGLFTVSEEGAPTVHGIAHVIDDLVLITSPVEKPKARTRSPRKPADRKPSTRKASS